MSDMTVKISKKARRHNRSSRVDQAEIPVLQVLRKSCTNACVRQGLIGWTRRGLTHRVGVSRCRRRRRGREAIRTRGEMVETAAASASRWAAVSRARPANCSRAWRTWCPTSGWAADRTTSSNRSRGRPAAARRVSCRS